MTDNAEFDAMQKSVASYLALHYLLIIILSGSNKLDPNQARHYVWPDLDPNCLQRLSADKTSEQRVYECMH